MAPIWAGQSISTRTATLPVTERQDNSPPGGRDECGGGGGCVCSNCKAKGRGCFGMRQEKLEGQHRMSIVIKAKY